MAWTKEAARGIEALVEMLEKDAFTQLDVFASTLFVQIKMCELDKEDLPEVITELNPQQVAKLRQMALFLMGLAAGVPIKSPLKFGEQTDDKNQNPLPEME